MTKKDIYREMKQHITNYDESKVPSYSLPSALRRPDGTVVSTAFEWMNSQRGHILKMFQEHVYGKIPPRPDEMRFELLSSSGNALNGLAIRKEVRLHCRMGDGKAHKMDLLIYLPKSARGPVPAFLGLNFKGNQASSGEKDILMPDCWFRDGEGYRGNRAGEDSRCVQEHRWQFEKVIRRGYASATICYNEIFPDHENGWNDSVCKLFYGDDEFRSSRRSFGAIGAWAWGLSRAMDYLEASPEIDCRRVAVHGHSRLGKTALLAGASDTRFAMVISNDSGCCGAAISRRCFGETFESIQNAFPHWFCSGFRDYMGRENDLPVDQHMLISLMAPRPAYIASATEDLWADPKGEFLSAVNALPVYQLFGSRGLGTELMPPPDTPAGADIGYHIRTGRHDINAFDWDCLLNFADRHFAVKKAE